ncbi:MAG: class I SAM-dependent methyltransferase, partial [Bacteroidales bacterium]|nr:class I SAM-dependent methyltransferase [Bacteroidales bacterium]
MNDIKNKWDERYAQKEYVYGKKPNEFFKQELAKHKPGKILLPAEGEGRNAVYAAKLGWEVYAFDSSSEAIKKAQQLASENNVEIHYTLSSFEEVDYPDDFFDLIGLFYAHTLSRSDNHKKLIRFLKPKGAIILEGFSKEQIHYNSGGPRKIEMLFSEEELQN